MKCGEGRVVAGIPHLPFVTIIVRLSSVQKKQVSPPLGSGFQENKI